MKAVRSIRWGTVAPVDLEADGSMVFLTDGRRYLRVGGAWSLLAGDGNVSRDDDLSSQCNGILTDFATAELPVASSVRLYWNGQRLIRNTHFTVSGSTISVVGFTPAAGQGLEAEYIPA